MADAKFHFVWRIPEPDSCANPDRLSQGESAVNAPTLKHHPAHAGTGVQDSIDFSGLNDQRGR